MISLCIHKTETACMCAWRSPRPHALVPGGSRDRMHVCLAVAETARHSVCGLGYRQARMPGGLRYTDTQENCAWRSPRPHALVYPYSGDRQAHVPGGLRYLCAQFTLLCMYAEAV